MPSSTTNQPQSVPAQIAPSEQKEPSKRRRGRPTREERSARRSEQSDFLVGCALDERAYCVALVRLLRENYWLAEVLRHILDKEALDRYNWTIKNVKEVLDNFATIDTLAYNAGRLGLAWSNHPVFRAIREERGDDEIRNYKSNIRIQELIESAHKK
jgi:hypothetical protein